jgi:hypothetical protein
MLLARCELAMLLLSLGWVVADIIRVLVVDTLALGWDGQSTGVINVEKMTFKFSKSWQRFLIEFRASNVSIKTLVRSSVEVVVTATANGSFEEIGIGIWDSSVIAVASKDTDAIQVRGCDFLMLLFEGIEGFSCAFDVIGC